MAAQHTISKTLQLFLWLAQGLLALTFLWAGYMKLFHPGDLPFPWVKDQPGLVVLTGVVDLLGGIGILLPALLRRYRVTLLAAWGILLLMLAAGIFHITRGEAKDIGFNIIMALLAGFVLWGYKKKVAAHPVA